MKTKDQIHKELTKSLKYIYENIGQMKPDELNRRAGVVEGYLKSLGVIENVDDIIDVKDYKILGIFPYKSKQPYWSAVIEFATEYQLKNC